MAAFQKSTGPQESVKPDYAQQLWPPPTKKASEGMGTTVWNWWAALTGSGPEGYSGSIEGQGRLRRARVVSALLMLGVVIVLFLIPSAITVPLQWTIVGILIVGFLVIALLNRGKYTILSSLACALLIDAAVAGYLIVKPALGSVNVPNFDLFILVALVGGATLPRALIPFTGLLQVALIMGIFFLRPHDPSLVQMIQLYPGHIYVLLEGPIVLQVAGTGIAVIYAWSVEHALTRANRAEELATAQIELDRQTEQIAEHNRRLEEGIAQILETHRQVSTGSLAVSVPMQEDHELWQIGHSLNLLIKRFQLQAQEYRIMQQTQHEIEQVTDALLSQRAGIPAPSPLVCHTPLAQRLLAALGF